MPRKGDEGKNLLFFAIFMWPLLFNSVKLPTIAIETRKWSFMGRERWEDCIMSALVPLAET
jgi:hypothetical protein